MKYEVLVAGSRIHFNLISIHFCCSSGTGKFLFPVVHLYLYAIHNYYTLLMCITILAVNHFKLKVIYPFYLYSLVCFSILGGKCEGTIYFNLYSARTLLCIRLSVSIGNFLVCF